MTKEELFALMEQIAEEREAARPVVEKLASGKEPIEDIEIPEGWRTAGMVIELWKTAAAMCDVQPVLHLSLLRVALSISLADMLGYPPLIQHWLRGYAWAEIGYTQTSQGWYDAALRAFDASEECLDTEATLGHDAAKVMLWRAAALAFVRRREEAFSFAEESARLFSEYGDIRRVLSAEYTKALSYSEKCEFAAARAAYEHLIPQAEAVQYTDFLARLHNNLGVVYRELGDAATSAVHLQRARALNAEIGNSMLVRKVDWGSARLLLSIGEFTKAEPMLRELRDLFLSQDMPEDAGLVALDLVEVLVETSRVREATALTEKVIGEFRDANLSHQLLIAMGYLRDLLSTTQRIREAVKHVRAYVEKSKREPALLFLPLEN